jgi:hypothetical protein
MADKGWASGGMNVEQGMPNSEVWIAATYIRWDRFRRNDRFNIRPADGYF